jgi:hypothetical protein
MKGPLVIGLVCLAAGGFLWFTTPHNVTWGNHHYFKHLASYALLGIGALFTIVGVRSK